MFLYLNFNFLLLPLLLSYYQVFNNKQFKRNLCFDIKKFICLTTSGNLRMYLLYIFHHSNEH